MMMDRLLRLNPLAHGPNLLLTVPIQAYCSSVQSFAGLILFSLWCSIHGSEDSSRYNSFCFTSISNAQAYCYSFHDNFNQKLIGCCRRCESSVPGNGLSVRWFLGYTCCDACGRLFVKGNYCPVCLKVYRDSESTPMVCCASANAGSIVTVME